MMQTCHSHWYWTLLALVALAAGCGESQNDSTELSDAVATPRPLQSRSEPGPPTAPESTASHQRPAPVKGTDHSATQPMSPLVSVPSRTTLASAPVAPVPPGGSNWPCFRGPNRLGVSNDQDLPLTWSDGENIVWKCELPGPGTSSPITWNQHVYLTCYSGYGLSESSPGNVDNLTRHLVCIDRDSGRIAWTKDIPNQAPVVPFQRFQALHGYVSGSPVADETGVYVMYGSSGAAAYTHAGELRWHKSLGTGIHDWGTSTSPVLFDNLVIFHADIESSALIALDKTSGNQVWKVPTGRQDSWSTPCLAKVGNRHELIFHHSKGEPATLTAIDPRDGSPRWQCRVLKDYLCPSPIVVGEMCYVLAHQRGGAIRLGGEGDVTESHLAWTVSKGTEICTPIYHDGHLYWAHQEQGIAYCLNAQTGRVVYEERIRPRPDLIYASGVLGDGKIYYVSRQNGTFVVAAAPEYRLLAHNTIESDESIFNATPAISNGQLLIRSNRFLYGIGTKR